MLSLRSIFLFAIAAITVFAVTYQDVLNDLKTLDTDINTLTSQVNAYTGAGSQTLALRNQVKKVQADLDKATSDTNSATVPAAADATTVYNYVNGQLLTDTKSSLSAASGKKSTFSANGVLTEFCGYVKDLKSRTDTLAAALINKAPNQDLKTKGAATQTQYDNAFNSAISTLGC